MQVQDFALAWEKVVFDVEPVHGFEMPALLHGGVKSAMTAVLIAFSVSTHGKSLAYRRPYPFPLRVSFHTTSTLPYA